MCAIWDVESRTMEMQEGFPLSAAAVQHSRFSVSVSNGSVMVVPLSQSDGTETQLHQIPTHVLNEQVLPQYAIVNTHTRLLKLVCLTKV